MKDRARYLRENLDVEGKSSISLRVKRSTGLSCSNPPLLRRLEPEHTGSW